MLLPKGHKLMMLFLSPRNVWWAEILKLGQSAPKEQNGNSSAEAKKRGRKRPLSRKRSVTWQDTLTTAGVSPGTWLNWRMGRRMAPESGDDVFDRVLVHINGTEYGSPEKKDRLRQSVEDVRTEFYKADSEQRHLYVAAKALFGMDISTGQQVLDEIIYDGLPLLSSVYRDEEAVNSTFNTYEGTYRLWMRREEPDRSLFWLQCTLRVRYVVRIRRGLVVRCKLNVAKKEPDPSEAPYWEYDGFLRVRSNKVFWMFEKRDNNRGDYISLITDTGHGHDPDFTMKGEYLTTGQDRDQSIVSGGVMLRRTRRVWSEEMEVEMHTKTVALRGEDAKEPRELWEAINSSR